MSSTSPDRPASGTPTANAERGARALRAVAVAVAVGLLAFAAVNVWFEATGRFAGGPYAAYASGIAVMDWLVTTLKVIGAGVALAAADVRPGRLSPAVVAVLVWAAFATFATYAVGSVAELVAWLTGLVPGPATLRWADLGYVTGTVAFATGFGVLAVAHARRHRPRRRTVVTGVLGGPALLAVLLAALPTALAAAGLMPSG